MQARRTTNVKIATSNPTQPNTRNKHTKRQASERARSRMKRSIDRACARADHHSSSSSGGGCGGTLCSSSSDTTEENPASAASISAVRSCSNARLVPQQRNVCGGAMGTSECSVPFTRKRKATHAPRQRAGSTVWHSPYRLWACARRLWPLTTPRPALSAECALASCAQAARCMLRRRAFPFGPLAGLPAWCARRD